MSAAMKSSPWTSRASPAATVPAAGRTSIPIVHENSGSTRRTASLSNIEKRMDDEAEEVLKNWDGNVKCRKQETISLRPRSGDRTRRKRSTNSVSGTGVSAQRGLSPARAPRHVVFPVIDVIKREDESFDTSSESIDEDGRSPNYTDCPDTGQRLFRMEFDAPGYDQENISVKIQGTRLIVQAIKKENVDGRKTTNQLCRKIKLPGDLEQDKLRCAYLGGKIVIEAPTMPILQDDREVVHMSNTLNPTYLLKPKSEPKNVPVFKDSPKGKELFLLVDIGRVFKADDIIVKVKGQDRLLISAKREENNPADRLSAALTREFYLDKKVVPASLKAGLTVDGVLKISATVDTEINVNGDLKGQETSSSSSSSQQPYLNGKAVKPPGRHGGAITNGAKVNAL